MHTKHSVQWEPSLFLSETCYKSTRFVDPMNKECSVCGGVCKKACLLPCNHLLGRACLDRLVNMCGSYEKLECLICRKPFLIGNVQLAQEMNASIEDASVYCTFAPCSFLPPLRQLEEHERTCLFRPAQCEECQMVVSMHELLERHNRVICKCGDMIALCMHNYHEHQQCVCGEWVSLARLSAHRNECPNRLEECPFCKKSVHHSLLAFHAQFVQCPSCSDFFHYCVANVHGVSLCKNNCSLELLCSKTMSSHLFKCQLERRPCKFQKIGCLVRLPLSELPNHESSIDTHLVQCIRHFAELDDILLDAAARNAILVAEQGKLNQMKNEKSSRNGKDESVSKSR